MRNFIKSYCGHRNLKTNLKSSKANQNLQYRMIMSLQFDSNVICHKYISSSSCILGQTVNSTLIARVDRKCSHWMECKSIDRIEYLFPFFLRFWITVALKRIPTTHQKTRFKRSNTTNKVLHDPKENTFSKEIPCNWI